MIPYHYEFFETRTLGRELEGGYQMVRKALEEKKKLEKKGRAQEQKNQHKDKPKTKWSVRFMQYLIELLY